MKIASNQLDHLKQLESESIFIVRETVAEFARPVMLYSIGKDSSVMLRLAQKAFYPAPLPFPPKSEATTWVCMAATVAPAERAISAPIVCQLGFPLVPPRF